MLPAPVTNVSVQLAGKPYLGSCSRSTRSGGGCDAAPSGVCEVHSGFRVPPCGGVAVLRELANAAVNAGRDAVLTQKGLGAPLLMGFLVRNIEISDKLRSHSDGLKLHHCRCGSTLTLVDSR